MHTHHTTNHREHDIAIIDSAEHDKHYTHCASKFTHYHSADDIWVVTRDANGYVTYNEPDYDDDDFNYGHRPATDDKPHTPRHAYQYPKPEPFDPFAAIRSITKRMPVGNKRVEDAITDHVLTGNGYYVKREDRYPIKLASVHRGRECGSANRRGHQPLWVRRTRNPVRASQTSEWNAHLNYVKAMKALAVETDQVILVASRLQKESNA